MDKRNKSIGGQKEKKKVIHRKMNPHTLEILTDKGCQLNQVHRIVNVFYSNDDTVIDKLKESLELSGFIVQNWEVCESARKPFIWCLEVEIDLPPILKNVNNMTDACVEGAELADVVYDGWYTEV